ncbi:hypothetical protein MY11210_006567 [Beauveria gryllotalpidicola]
MVSFYRTAAIAATAFQGAQAWGSLGHATVAYIAQNYLTNDTTVWAQDVLGDSSDSYLASIASWADDYRSTTAGQWSAPLHYIDAEDNPPTSCNVDYERDCGSTGCSISAIANYTQRVGDGRLSAAHVNEALKFLVHFMGDVTQPLHDEAYEVGGNDIKVTFDGYSDNLHSDWDTYIPQKKVGGSKLTDAQSWASALVAEIESGALKGQAAGWISGDNVADPIASATRWASDANAYVCSVVMPDGAAALQQGDLYPDYYNSVIDTVELQVAKGGYRLGNWLNNIYSSKIAKRSVDVPLPDLSGRDLLPADRPLSRAKLAREAMGESVSGQAANSLLAQMMLSEEYSDMSFSCNGKLFKVHKVVVCPQSSVIRAAMCSGFQESESGNLNMDAFTPESVQRFRQFLYTKDYDVIDAINIRDEGPQPADHATADRGGSRAADAADSTNRETSAARGSSLDGEVDHPEARDPTFRTILAHIRMNAMGDYYDLPELVKFANARVNAALAGASPDAPWVAGLPYIAEAALDIVNNESLTEALTTAVSENIGTIIAKGTLEGSPLVTPFCLEVLKKCNATSQALSETLSHKKKLLNKVYTKYQMPFLEQWRGKSILSTLGHCRNKSCGGIFNCYFGANSGRLHCRICHMKQ